LRLLRLRIRHLGPLVELDTGHQRELPDLIAVLGRNEAGKSTFHQAVVALLYGFYPATRDGYPLAPWSGASPEVEAWMEVEGQAAHLHRRLLSRPDAVLTVGEEVRELRNRELPWVSHVDLGVFKQVYALTLQDLAALEKEGWQAVQDRLVVGMGADDLASPRAVARTLEDRAGSLWRTTARGNQRVRLLRSQLRSFRAERREAVDRDREIRALDHRRGEIADALDRLRDERTELDRRRARIERLRPLAGRLEQVRRLEGEVGNREELEGLPVDPAGALEELGQRVAETRERRDDLRRRVKEAETRAEGPGPGALEVLREEGDLRRLSDQAPLLQERAVERGRRESRVARIQRELAEQTRPLSSPVASGRRDPADPGDVDHARDPESGELALDRLWEPVQELPLDRLEATLRDAAEVDVRRGALREALDRARLRRLPEAAGRPPVPALLGLGIGVLVLAAAVFLGMGTAGSDGGLFWTLLAVGVAGLTLGGFAVARWLTRRGLVADALDARDREIQDLETRLQALEGERATAMARAGELLAPLPLRPDLREDPDASLVRALERVRSLLTDLDEERNGLAALVAADREIVEALDRAREALPELEDLPHDPVVALPELGRRLDRWIRAGEESEKATLELEGFRQELARVEEALQELEARRTTLEVRIRRAAGTDAPLEEAGIRAAERLRALDALERMEAELVRGFPDLEKERRELAEARDRGERWLTDPDALAELDSARRAMEEKFADLRGHAERIDEQIRGLEREDTVDVVDSRILAMEEELELVREERDRLWVLARLIRVAERRFREEHQPDLLRRAGRHLARITGGRYARILLSEAAEDEPFTLGGEHLPRPLPIASPLSTGTTEQVYLALRLAIVDHLDGDRIPLPLFLDEVLVNWDLPRRRRGLDVLAEMSARRQVFLFTCHADVGREVEDRGGAVIELPPPEEPA
jgi:uncharacterized protein YhaN